MITFKATTWHLHMLGAKNAQKWPGFFFPSYQWVPFLFLGFKFFLQVPYLIFRQKKFTLEEIFCKRHLLAVVCTKRKGHVCVLCHSIFLCFDAGHAWGVLCNRQRGNISDLLEDFCARIYFLKNSSCFPYDWNVHGLWKKQRSSEVHIKSSHVFAWNDASCGLQILFNDAMVSRYF